MKHRWNAQAKLSAVFYSLSFFLFFGNSIKAQLCNGSLGDAIININFGAGSGLFGTSLGASTTSYGYTSASFPNDGSYTIENSTAGAGSVWWSTTDHTGNPGGYMMVVNASVSKTDYFYKNTITGLCGGTTYEFAAWIVNLLKSQDKSPPDITFVIETTDGSILNSYSTGSIPLASSAVWKQFGFYFTTPQNVSTVVIRMRNKSAGGAPANDLALDDITFRPCGATMKASVNKSSISNYTVCAGANVSFSLLGEMSSSYSDTHVQWQVNDGSGWKDLESATALNTTVSLENTIPGVYTYRMAAAEGSNYSSAQCRVYSNSILITVQDNPVANYGTRSDTACASAPVYFLDKTVTAASLNYLWSFGDGTFSTEKDPAHKYSASGSYSTSLIVMTENGCGDTASLDQNILVKESPAAAFSVTPKDTSIYYPNVVFTDHSRGGVSCSITWGDGETTSCATYKHTYAQAGSYTVKETITNSEGCSSVSEQLVLIHDEFSVFIPNAFSPNDDGLNDIFLPVVNAVSHYYFIIFDRWGHKVFETNDSSAGWNGYLNGKLCPKDIYVYKLSLKDDVGQETYHYTGKILLYLPEFITSY